MQALRFLGPNELSLDQVPAPRISSGLALLAPSYVGICGSDLLIASGGLARVKPGVTLGHEMVCRVIEATGHEAGELVFVDPLIPCGDCPTCLAGYEHVCENLGLYGIDRDGGLAEQLLVPEANLIPVAQSVDVQAAALIEPLSVAVHMVRRATESQEAESTDALVIGGGPIGLLVAIALRSLNSLSPTILELNPRRVELAKSLGFCVVTELAPNPNQFDLVFEATGIAPATQLALQVAKPRATVLFGGLAHAPIELDTATIVMRELKILGSRVYERKDILTAVDLLSSGSIDPKPLISSVVSLARAIPDGFEKLKNSRDEMKILIEVGG